MYFRYIYLYKADSCQ